MKQRWEDYDRAAKQGPLALGFKVVIGIVLLGGLMTIAGWFFGIHSARSPRIGGYVDLSTFHRGRI